MPRPPLTALAFALLLAATASCGSGARSVDAPTLRGGRLDLTGWSFEANGTVGLAGEWEMCWGELVAPDDGACPGGWQSFPVPRLWSDSGVSSPVRPKGVASYRATLALPEAPADLTLRAGAPMTAHRLWINGKARGGAGTVGRSPADTVAKLENRLHPLPPGASHVELLVHVANFEFRGGGLRRRWYVGLDPQVRAQNGYELLLYTGFTTACVVIGLVFLAQFTFRTSDRARGWFGLWALLVGLRILPGSEGDLYQLSMGWASFGLLIRLEYLNTALLIAVGLAYLRDKIPGVMPTRLTQLLLIAALALVPIHLFAGLDGVLATLPAILVLPSLAIGLAIASYGRATRQGLPGAGATLAVGLAFALGIAHDVLRTQTGLGAPIELFPYFVVAFIASEAHALLRSFASSYSKTERLSEDLQESNFELQETEEAIVRFVPFDFLRALGKKSIREVSAGDHIEVEASILCCDLQADPAAADFAGVARRLERVEPLVRAHQGFVIQAVDDRIVALFPGGPADAVEAARRVLDLGTGHAASGVAVASGRVTLGTVGHGESLTTVVVGGAVARARRLHDRACATGAGLLLCEATRAALGDRARPG